MNRSNRKELRQKLRGEASVPEVILWFYLRGRQMDGWKFRRQQGVGRYVVDFYCPRAKLAVEIDGDSHLGEEAVEYDLQRDVTLAAYGIKTIRFSNAEVMGNLEGVVERIKDELRMQKPLLSPPQLLPKTTP